MNQEQTAGLLASLVDVIATAVRTEVLLSLDKESVITKAIHTHLDYDEGIWNRIATYVDQQKAQGSSGEPVSSEDFTRKVDAILTNWSEKYFDDKVDEWMESYLNDRLDTWMTHNFSLDDYGDIDSKIKDVIRDEVSFSVTVDY